MRTSLLALALVACDKPYTGPMPDDSDTTNDGDTDTTDDTLDSDDPPPQGPLRCEPLNTSLTIDGSAETVQFSASMETDDGVVPVTANWVIDGPGTVSTSGMYTSPTTFGGIARVSAVYDSLVATCTVEVETTGRVNQSGSGSVPGAFDSATLTADDGCAPTLLYPLANSAMPASFAPPLIQWQDSGANMFRLELSTQYTTLTIDTDDTSYQPAADAWLGLTRYDPDVVVKMHLTSGSWNGSAFTGPVCTMESPIEVEVADDGIDGTIIYWAPPVTKAVTFVAGLPATNENLGLTGTCDGCHSVNLAMPSRLAYGPSFPGKTNLVDLTAPNTIIRTWGNSGLDMRDYGAPDDTGTYIVITKVALMGSSSMSVYEQHTGTLVSAITTSRSPTMPNWSPDGTKLVYAGCDAGSSLMGASNCDLYVQTWNSTTKTFSGETRIATHPAGTTLYYPTFSPDSQWVAYNQAEQYTTADGTVSSYANPKAKVKIVAASGGTTHTLASANGVGDLTNSWPRWAPAYGDYAWVAYSTTRPYGTQVSGRAQLWVTAIDLQAAANGAADASKAPTWIPGQLISESNHTPTWLPAKD